MPAPDQGIEARRDWYRRAINGCHAARRALDDFEQQLQRGLSATWEPRERRSLSSELTVLGATYEGRPL